MDCRPCSSANDSSTVKIAAGQSAGHKHICDQIRPVLARTVSPTSVRRRPSSFVTSLFLGTNMALTVDIDREAEKPWVPTAFRGRQRRG